MSLTQLSKGKRKKNSRRKRKQSFEVLHTRGVLELKQ